MSAITNLEPGFYRVPLPTVLTDSTHGEMRAFELCTVRVRDADGAEGIGYTFTVGRNGGAIHDILHARCPRSWPARTPTGSSSCGRSCGGRCTMAAAAVRPCWRSPPSTWRSGT